ncbi:10289_t:CDS:2, partial [Cetraspora pellucida]
KKEDRRQYPNKVELEKQHEVDERETRVNNIEQHSEAYNNHESLDQQKFSSHPIPSEKRNPRQLPKIITDPTKLAIISDYNRRNHRVSNNNNNYNNNYSSFNRDNVDEKLIKIRKSITKQEIKPAQVSPGICPNCNGPIDEFGYYARWYRAHNLDLAIDICEGFHPAFKSKIPKCYFDVMNQCLSLDPFMRPTAEQLYQTFGEWLCMLSSVPNSYIAEQFQETEEGLPLFDNKFEVHPEA